VIVLKNILVATDFSPPSEAALVYGRALARTFGATLHLVHVIENLFLTPMAADPHDLKAARVRALQHQLTDEDRKVLHARVAMEVSDSPPAAIIDYAKAAKIDLIVVGTHGRSAMSQLLVGSVAERVVRTAPCPVLTVRHPEHEFVVPDLPEKRGGHDSPQENSRCH
jgi:nucleotide-binding universal stress UspA family protein